MSNERHYSWDPEGETPIQPRISGDFSKPGLTEGGMGGAPHSVSRALVRTDSESAAAHDADDADEEEMPSRVQSVCPPRSPEDAGRGASETFTRLRPRSMRGIVGESDALLDVYGMVDRVAASTCTVLITGESGTGKELVARAIHSTSTRADRPFVVVNCGAIPEELLETELFGHVKGAFTGAHATKVGRIAIAEGGTLFLDEIGELPLKLQVKLLRLLQDSDYSPVGDTRTMTADVRIVAATNRSVEQLVAQGAFREDLYYRLNVVQLHLPPLRERAEDIPGLVQFFLHKAAKKTGVPVKSVSRATAQLLTLWPWPGNVRELENAIERASVFCAGDTIEPQDLPAKVCGLGPERRVTARLPDAGIDLRRAVETFENDLIRQALERTGWNKARAAALLGVKRTTLVEMLKRKRMLPEAA